MGSNNKYVTPEMLGITQRLIEPPKNGWKERSYYVVQFAVKKHHIVRKGIFYTGIIYETEPMAYNSIAKFTYEDYPICIQELYYCKALMFIYSED